MKTLLQRIKTALQDNATLASYIKGIQIVAPNTLPDLSSSLVPWLGVAPVSSSEIWKSNAQKEVTHLVDIYVVQYLQIQETSILGSGSDRGLLDVLNDTETVVRGNYFSVAGDYLSKPADVIRVSYTTAGYGDNIFLIVSTISLSCARIFSA